MFKSKLFWGGVLLCVVVLFGVLLHRANQPQETIKIYKTVVPEKRTTPQSVDKQKEQNDVSFIKHENDPFCNLQFCFLRVPHHCIRTETITARFTTKRGRSRTRFQHDSTRDETL